MKRAFIVITLFVLFLYSCDKNKHKDTEPIIDNKTTMTIPGIEGSWKWDVTVVGGFVGIYDADIYNSDCVLIFEKDNLMSLKDGDEYVIYQEKFKISEPDDIPFMACTEVPAGEYLIELPENVQNVIEEYFADYNHEIFIDGYVSILTENDNTTLNIIKDPDIELDDCNYLGSHYVRE